MIIKIDHITKYSYSVPQRSLIQILRLSPSNNSNQYVANWNINLDCDATLTPYIDAYGNQCHTLAIDKPTSNLVIETTGVVETFENSGVVLESNEPLPPLVFCQSTKLTNAGSGIIEFANDIAGKGDNLSKCHNFLAAIYEDFKFEIGYTDVTTDADSAFAAKRGVCQDLAHVFIASSRSLGIPSRYISGHLLRSDGLDVQEAAHGWAQSYIDGLGWVGFDAANGICTDENYVQVAIGLDYAAAAPLSGARYGGGHEVLSVDIQVRQSQYQGQN